jgi:predicted kinase
MIIMLNGAFGVGKTTLAEALCRALPNTMLYDPEMIGIMLRYLTAGTRRPAEDTDDFQDIALWPTLTVAVAEHLVREYGRSLIVPMTLAHPGYLETIQRGLARVSPPLYHFCLTAPLDIIHQRLHERGGDPAWPWRKSQQYAPLFEHPRYRIQLSTDGVSTATLVTQIQAIIADHPNGAP